MNVISLIVFSGLACKKPVPPPPPPPPVIEEAPPPPAPAPPEVVLLAQNFQRVFFDVDSTSLSEESRQALQENVTILIDNPNIRIEVQGHADERGTTEYNMALGEKRASVVLNFMTTQGIASSRVRIISFGEERPISQTASEIAWSQNRRCEFRITFSDVEHVHGTD